MHRHTPRLGALLLVSFLASRPVAAGEPGVPDAELQARIDIAIEKGAAWLRSKQKANGSVGGIVNRGADGYEIGVTALAGLALLAAGDAPGKASVDQALAFCRSADRGAAAGSARRTYDTGSLLLFVTAYYRPKELPPEPKHAGTVAPKPEAKNPCKLPKDVMAWVQEMADFLGRSQKEDGTWGYPMHRGDFSNTQYALLGLRAARDCGAVVPSMVFHRAMRFALDHQEKDGPKVKRLVPSSDPGGSPYVIDGGDRARGWSYLLEPFTTSGSMTTSGIASLAICNDALLAPARSDRYLASEESDVRRAIQDGFAWLDVQWTVTRNPGENAPAWHHYYLYGLERAGALAGRALVGTHDWYVEGSRHLVSTQKSDGKWSTGALGWKEDYDPSDTLDTAWAILFLKRATRPAKPVPAPVVTQGD
jgi:hypothetical protein